MSLQVDGFDFLVFHGLEHKPDHLYVISLKLGSGIGLFFAHGFFYGHVSKQQGDGPRTNPLLAILVVSPNLFPPTANIMAVRKPIQKINSESAQFPGLNMGIDADVVFLAERLPCQSQAIDLSYDKIPVPVAQPAPGYQVPLVGVVDYPNGLNFPLCALPLEVNVINGQEHRAGN